MFTVDPNALLVFLPAFFRIGGMIFVGPLWNQVRVPLTVKAGLTLFLAIALWPAMSAGPVPEVLGLWGLGSLVFRELLVGILIGLAANLVFVAVEYAGQLVGVSIGLAIVNVLDPFFNTRVSIISRVYGLFSLAVFFAIDAHHLLLGAVMGSFDTLPVGAASLSPGIASALVDMGMSIFTTGIRIAAPILGVMLLSELAMGLVVRTVPQMNIFIVGFPLKIGLGFFMIAVTLPYLVSLLEQLFLRLDGTISYLVGGM